MLGTSLQHKHKEVLLLWCELTEGETTESPLLLSLPEADGHIWVFPED